MKIYFLVFEGWPGVETALRCVEKTIKNCYPQAKTEFLPLLTNGKLNFSSLRKVKTSPPDFLFLGGWDQNVKTFLLNASKAKTKSILLWCSPITQMELSNEITRFSDVWNLLNEGKLNKLGIILDTDAKVLNSYNSNVIHTPIFMDENNLNLVSPQSIRGMSNEKINIDLFCAPCPRKNIMSQLFALSKLDNVIIHTNYFPSVMTSQYLSIANLFNSNNFFNHSWLARNHYLGIIQNMYFGSQVTLSESFNYTAAEHMFYGVPVILSPCSPIAKRLKNVISDLIVKKPDDIAEIYNVAIKMIENHDFRNEMGLVCKKAIGQMNNEHLEILTENVSGILEGIK